MSLPTETEELIKAIEDTFEIRLLKDDLSSISTIEDLVMCVYKKVQVCSGGCPNMKAFHHIRDILIVSFGVPRSQVTLQADLSQLINPGDRKRFLELMNKMTETSFPFCLVLPEKIARIIAYSSIIPALIPIVAIATTPNWFQRCLFAIFTITAIFFINRILNSLRTEFPYNMKTVEACVARFSIMLQQSKPKPTYWSQTEIRDIIRAFVTKICDLNQFDYKWRFNEDIGIE